jgi:hypothetical protein
MLSNGFAAWCPVELRQLHRLAGSPPWIEHFAEQNPLWGVI